MNGGDPRLRPKGQKKRRTESVRRFPTMLISEDQSEIKEKTPKTSVLGGKAFGGPDPKR